MSNASVSMQTRAHVVTDTGHRFPVDMRLHYTQDDPHGVRAEVTFSNEAYCEVVFARELLTHGIAHHVGHGDVGVRPGSHRNETRIRLPGGERLDGERRGGERQDRRIEPLTPVVDTHSLIEFLGRTYRLVPPGLETMEIGLDAGALADM
ncbi:SsgA family sporulation/cell division regulator [Streptomyces sp. NPDC058579]|uniref:SsgA family sporulation/cell division regulator n=1 Tax=Streptomyces sp. NPDC058579 TaxID=3346548 RepID=UPI0036473B0B